MGRQTFERNVATEVTISDLDDGWCMVLPTDDSVSSSHGAQQPGATSPSANNAAYSKALDDSFDLTEEEEEDEEELDEEEDDDLGESNQADFRSAELSLTAEIENTNASQGGLRELILNVTGMNSTENAKLREGKPQKKKKKGKKKGKGRRRY